MAGARPRQDSPRPWVWAFRCGDVGPRPQSGSPIGEPAGRGSGIPWAQPGGRPRNVWLWVIPTAFAKCGLCLGAPAAARSQAEPGRSENWEVHTQPAFRPLATSSFLVGVYKEANRSTIHIAPSRRACVDRRGVWSRDSSLLTHWQLYLCCRALYPCRSALHPCCAALHPYHFDMHPCSAPLLPPPTPLPPCPLPLPLGMHPCCPSLHPCCTALHLCHSALHHCCPILYPCLPFLHPCPPALDPYHLPFTHLSCSAPIVCPAPLLPCPAPLPLWHVPLLPCRTPLPP